MLRKVFQKRHSDEITRNVQTYAQMRTSERSRDPGHELSDVMCVASIVQRNAALQGQAALLWQDGQIPRAMRDTTS